MLSLWSRLRSLLSPVPNCRRSTPNRPRLGVETLEGRSLPSVSPHVAALHDPGHVAGQHQEVEPAQRIQIEVGQTHSSGQVEAPRREDRQNERQADRQQDRQVERQADRQQDHQAERQQDRGAERQMDRPQDR